MNNMPLSDEEKVIKVLDAILMIFILALLASPFYFFPEIAWAVTWRMIVGVSALFLVLVLWFRLFRRY